MYVCMYVYVLYQFTRLHARPVLEYAAPVWHHSLNKSNQIELIQKGRCGFACDMPYSNILFVAGIQDLASHRDLLSRVFQIRLAAIVFST